MDRHTAFRKGEKIKRALFIGGAYDLIIAAREHVIPENLLHDDEEYYGYGTNSTSSAIWREDVGKFDTGAGFRPHPSDVLTAGSNMFIPIHHVVRGSNT